MRALVTGSSGFLGRHFLRALVARDYEVHGIDLVPARGCWQADVRELFAIGSVRYDLVIHCAAVVGGRAVIESEPMKVAVDLAIDADLFAWALRTRPGKVVYLSSSAAYPIALQTGAPRVWLSEDDIDLDNVRQPDEIYGWVKLTGEQQARHAAAEGCNILVLRPFSGCGQDQDASYPVPAIAQRAKAGENPLEIWSNSVRDFVHVEDLVAATMALVEADVTGPVNIATGEPTPFCELARLMDPWAEIKIRNDKPAGVNFRVGDPTLLNQYYTPKIDAEEIAYRMVQS